MKKINLKFDNTITRIAGNDYGKEVYKKQVEPYITDIMNNKYEIIFPNNIMAVANSFVQGFIFEISKKIIPELFYEYFDIVGTDTLKNDFREGLFY